MLTRQSSKAVCRRTFALAPAQRKNRSRAGIAGSGSERRMGLGGAVLAVLALVVASGPAAAQTLRERGAYLVEAVAVCGNCHTPRDAGGKPDPALTLAGGFAIDLPSGHAVAPNITPDEETGIGGWSIGQIVYALRNGKRPDGTIIGPPMPTEFYRRLSDRDAEAIAVYLKRVTPIRRNVERSTYTKPLPSSYGSTVGHVAEPDAGDRIAYGAYLAGPVAHCLECHTPRHGPALDTDHLGAGGRDFPDPANPGARTVSRNITPDETTGLGRWSDADIKRAILVGTRPDGTRLSPIMPSYAYNRMSSDDVNAIVFYLRSLKPQR